MRALFAFTTLLALAQQSAAQDMTTRLSERVRVGETKRLYVACAHSFDCKKSLSGEVEIKKSPSRGRLSQRCDVPYVVRTSLSHTCLGAQFLGTAVDYTASSPGPDSAEFDALFANGRLHYAVSIVNY
jgi:hypothetical protein